MTSNNTLILLGATGETGKQALLAALASPSISHIHSFGRTPPTIPPPTAVSNPDQSKLTHHHLDFELLCDQGPQGEEGRKLKDVGADAVVIALGTTAKLAGSGDRFERIDREYVLKAAEAARVPDKDQKVVYVSVRFPYPPFPSPPLPPQPLSTRNSLSLLRHTGPVRLLVRTLPLPKVEGLDGGRPRQSRLHRHRHCPSGLLGLREEGGEATRDDVWVRFFVPSSLTLFPIHFSIPVLVPAY